LKKTKKSTIEDTYIRLENSKSFKDDDGYVYIIFDEIILDLEKASICIFDCPNCQNYDCKAEF